MELMPLLSACDLHCLTRIDVGLEGDWSPTARAVWTREDGTLSLGGIVREHATLKPSLELYFDDGWIGIHCYRRVESSIVLDEDLLRKVIDQVEAAMAVDE